MPDAPAITTFLFTDIEGSTRLWEREPARMHDALARHDALTKQAVEAHRGRVVKTTGDGVHAVFGDPLDGLLAAIDLQVALQDPAATAGVALVIRCGLHAGSDNRRDNDHYGIAVNRAARVMSAAHGGQVLVTQAVATLVSDRLSADVELVPLGSVRLRDLSQPENVYQVAHPQLRREFPALRSLESTPNNQPQQLTSFIGREHELGEVRRQLRDTRLLTIFGIGGLGKSRLSLHVASDVLADYADGVWFIELAPIGDGRLVAQAAASVLGVKDESGEPLVDTVARFARDRRMLLVLDNCEHVTQACAEFARRILETAPNVRILATSRERLGIAGEKTYPLAPFAVPLPQQKLAPDAVLAFASVRLFAERAAAARPDFAITQDNMRAVAEICHRLDGIPLALELAAARVRALRVQSIAERLNDRFRLLSGGDRTALPRQQTLRALIDWSFELLEPRERILFARLAVFAGGLTLEDAEKVASGGDITEADVLELVTQLVEKSLLMLDLDSDRYSMLETVRQYAADRLREGGEETTTRDAHVDRFLALAEEASSELLGPGAARALRNVDAERENILAAHAWCDRGTDGAHKGLRLARAMRNYFLHRGPLDLGLSLMVEALARRGAQARDLPRCRALSAAGQYALRMGRLEEAIRYLEDSLAIARELGDDERIAVVLQPVGLTYLDRGDASSARAYLTEALDRAQARDDKRELAAAQSAMAQLCRCEGDLDGAERMSRSSLALVREVDDMQSIGVALVNLAMISILRARGADARAMLQEILTINAKIGGAALGQSTLEVAMGLAAGLGDYERAARLYGAVEACADASGLRRDAADEAYVSAIRTRTCDSLGEARFAAAVATGREAPSAAIAELETWLGA
jgi:predicted ATPase/class 3 adenylate cyclase